MSVSRKTGEIYYTEEELHAALRNNNALQYALSRGYGLVKCGNEYHMKEHDSMVFKRDGRWYWNSRSLSGKALDFIQAYEDRDYKEAVCILAGTAGRSGPAVPQKALEALPPEEKAEFILPEPARDCKHLFAYLIKTRGVDPGLVKRLVSRHGIYPGIVYDRLRIVGYDRDGKARYGIKEKFQKGMADIPLVQEDVSSRAGAPPSHTVRCLSADTLRQLLERGQAHTYQNLVMLGYGPDGNPRYASMRSMNSAGKAVKVDVPGSDKSYPFVLEGEPGNSTVCVFESPIEAMSYWTLCKVTESGRISCPMISLGGAAVTLALDRYLKGHPGIRRIVVGLNNDTAEFGHTINAGRNGAEKIQKLYGKSYLVSRHCPHLDDWNDVLKDYRKNLEGKLQGIGRAEPVRNVTKSKQLGVAI